MEGDALKEESVSTYDDKFEEVVFDIHWLLVHRSNA